MLVLTATLSHSGSGNCAVEEAVVVLIATLSRPRLMRSSGNGFQRKFTVIEVIVEAKV